MNQPTFNPGEAARIRQSIHAPYAGHVGTILGVNDLDDKGPYLVLFSDGLQFRYRADEIETLNGNGPTGIMESVYRVISETGQGLWRGNHR